MEQTLSQKTKSPEKCLPNIQETVVSSVQKICFGTQFLGLLRLSHPCCCVFFSGLSEKDLTCTLVFPHCVLVFQTPESNASPLCVCMLLFLFVFCCIFILCSILTCGVHTSASAGALSICSLLSLLRLAGASHSGVREEFAGRVNL